MSKDDDNSTTGESSPNGPRLSRDTLLSGFAASVPEVLDASTKPDFEAPQTVVSSTPDFSHDANHIRATVDRVWDEMFEAEETRPSQILDFPEDRALALAAESDAELVQAVATDLDETPDTDPARPNPDHSFEGALDDIEIDDVLPDPIRDDPAPTQEDLLPATDEIPAEPRTPTPYPGDNTPITAFADARTELLESPFESDPVVAKLVVVDGPAVGQQFFASSLRNTVGRDTTNAIVVGDLAMSREHFEIVRNPDDTFTLVDLNSINGTVLNGTRVREADLLHGDRVEAGSSRFQFIVTPHPVPSTVDRRIVRAASTTLAGADVSPPAVAATSTSANRLIVTFAIGALIISIALFAIVATLKFSKPAPPPTQPTEGPTSFYLRGVDAVKARDWDQAYAEFSAARTLDPGIEGVDLQLRRVEIERGAKMSHERAIAHRDEGRAEDALDALANIPEDSVYAADAEKLRRSIRAEQVTLLYQQAQQALAAGNVDDARKLADEILQRVPSHRGALEIVEQHAGEPAE